MIINYSEGQGQKIFLPQGQGQIYFSNVMATGESPDE